MAGLFDTKLSPKPIVRGNDFRVKLSDKVLEQLKTDYENDFRDAQEVANRDLWRRMETVVQAMRDRLSDPKAIFRDSLVGNIRELVNVMDGLNVFDDAQLRAFTDEVRDNLTESEPQCLRDDANARKYQADKANDILSRIQAANMSSD